MEGTINRIQRIRSDSQSVAKSSLWDGDENIQSVFWQEWQEYQDHLYRCCIKWMNGNPTDAEDALSRAMFKALKKVQKYGAGEIANFKAWLTKLTHNLCVDIYRERNRGAIRVDNIEVYGYVEEQGLVSPSDTPLSALETDEKKIVIRSAIDNLPPRLRETFRLHFYEELSYQDIAQQQDISYQNVCKRISQARAILAEELRGYFMGEDGRDRKLSVTPSCREKSNLERESGEAEERKLHCPEQLDIKPSLAVTESVKGEISQEHGEIEPIVEEIVTLSVAVAEVEIVVSESPIEVALSVQHSESVTIAANCDRKIEVKRDSFSWVNAALYERQLAPILTWAQLNKETGIWGNFCLVMLWIQQQSEVVKGWRDFFLPSRSPPALRSFYSTA